MFGPVEASRRTKVPERTIRGWAFEQGLKAPEGTDREAAKVAEVAAVIAGGEPKVTAADVEEARLTIEEKAKLKRQIIRHDLLEKIHDALRRMDESHLEFFPLKDTLAQATYPKAPANAFRAYAQAFATLFKEYRLESGESTDRTEQTQRILDVVHDDHERQLLKRVLDMALEDDEVKPEA